MFFAFLVSYDCIPGHDVFVLKISIRPYPMPALSQTHRPKCRVSWQSYYKVKCGYFYITCLG